MAKEDIAKLSTEELRTLKKDIEAELSRRYNERNSKKNKCQECEYCKWTDNAHPSWPRWSDRGGYRCTLYGNHGKIIDTKYVAPFWCPKEKEKSPK